ncbi:MAG: hypothetical protein ACUVTX_11875, partial [Bacteroidales bacterium]
MTNLRIHPLYQKHNLDTVISSLWNFYKQKFLALFLISLIVSLINQFGILLIDFKEIQNIADPAEILTYLRSKIVPLSGILVISLYFNVILNYYVLNKPLDNSVNALNSTWRSIKYFLPYLIIIIIFSFVGSFILVLGILALIVGVFFAILYLIMIYFFILPVMMAEENNIGNVITRTFKLSHMNFWPNLGWSAVIILIYFVLSFILSGLVMLPFTGTFLKALISQQDIASILNVDTNPLMLVLSSISIALLLTFLPVFSF